MARFARWQMHWILPVAAFAAVLLQASPITVARAAGSEPLPVLTRVGPWPVVSEPVLFDGRLWFANSVKGVDHNSAEIYSLESGSDTVRYERHLWSQDAGEPIVSGNLLYWPAEDSRLFADWGAFQVTNGRDWKTGLIPFDGIFHVHSMAATDGRLFAATSAWQTFLFVSEDDGRRWRRIYSHPKSPDGLNRIVSLEPLGARVIGVLREPSGYRLLSAGPDGAHRIEGWPPSDHNLGVAALKDWAYALVNRADGVELWRTDGLRAEKVHRFASSRRPFALTSGDGALWALNQGGADGTVLKSRDGREWTSTASFAGGDAYDLLAIGRTLVVTGAGADGRGILWGRMGSSVEQDRRSRAELPDLSPAGTVAQVDWPDAGARLDAALLDDRSYERVGRSMRDLVYRLAVADPPPDFFTRRLASPRASGRLNPFRDVVVSDRGSIGAFWLLWGFGLTRTGPVPPGLIDAPWRTPDNSAAKYFEPQLMAMWAVAEMGQADRPTIDALIDRAMRESDPLWLRMDAVGALTSLTGARHGANFAAWKTWSGR